MSSTFDFESPRDRKVLMVIGTAVLLVAAYYLWPHNAMEPGHYPPADAPTPPPPGGSGYRPWESPTPPPNAPGDDGWNDGGFDKKWDKDFPTKRPAQ